jgi:hypothetical protein
MREPVKKKYEPEIIYDPNLPDFSQSPYVLKKNEIARAFIAKNGLPKEKPKKGK